MHPMCLEVPVGSRFLQNGFDGWNSKGAEWTMVFVTGVADGILPHAKAEDTEEERRLFYVAVTRAKKVCIVSSGSDEPSPFFEELRAALQLEEKGGGAPEYVGAAVRPDAAVTTGTAESSTAVPASAPPSIAKRLDNIHNTIDALYPEAQRLGEAEEPTPGSRFVVVRLDSMKELLEPLGFIEEEQHASQRIFALQLPEDYLVRVFSTIPQDLTAAREVGADSIKVVGYWHGRPIHKKHPHACRTRSWRTTLLDKIAVTLALVASREGIERLEIKS